MVRVEAGSVLADRYRLDRPIGSGGMGQVWAAHDTVLGRDVAVKLQRVDPNDGQAEVERFLREARTTAALQHPHVVTVYDSGTEGDQAFLVMELLPGPSLQAYVKARGPLPEDEAVSLAAQIASGLAAAHGAGVVHRDIKPANVMFDAQGTIKIVDFGIARLTATTSTKLTALNAIIGSPPYLSPEQFEGRPADERSDLYALGCVLMTLLTGRPPFAGEHPLAYGHQHVSATPPRIGERRPGVAPAVEALVERLLSKDPADRPQTARDVLHDLTQPPQLPSTAPMPEADEEEAAPTLPRGTIPQPPMVPATAGEGPERRNRRAPAARWLVAAALALILAAVVWVFAATRADTPTASQAAPQSSSTIPSQRPTTSKEPTPQRSSAAEESTGSETKPSPKEEEATSDSGDGETRSDGENEGPSDDKSSRADEERSRADEESRGSGPEASRPEPEASRSEPEGDEPDEPSTDPEDEQTSSPPSDPEPNTSAGLRQALSDLRAAASEEIDSGQIDDDKAAKRLAQRVDVLVTQLSQKTGDEAADKVADFDQYLTELSQSGTLTPAGAERLRTALQEVSEQLEQA